jgi:sigma-B regulation protein RsbU (phosphoserine phosphatase)
MIGICTLVCLTGLGVTAIAHRNARTTTATVADSLFREVSAHAVTRTTNFVLRAVPLIESMARLSHDGLALDDTDRLARQLLAVLDANPGFTWISFGDEAGTFTGVYRLPDGRLRVNQSRIEDGKTRLVEHDVRADLSWKFFRSEADSGYDPRKRPFYERARGEKRPVWHPPYIFYDQAVPGISCSRAVYDEAGRMRGVLSVDFDLNSLSQFLADLSVSPNGKVLMFTSDGVLLAQPGRRVELRKEQRGQGRLLTLDDVSDPVIESYRARLQPAHTQPARATTAFHSFEFRHADRDYIASATSFPIGDDLVWVFGAAAPKDDFLARVWQSQWQALAVAAAAVLLAVLLAAVMARRVSGQVLALVNFMHRVGGGDLEAPADFGGNREFRVLSHALNRMIADLRDRLRLRHSMDVAMAVQQRLLPAEAPRTPGLDIAGHSTYCDETGGDYYDYLFLDEPANDKLLVAVGDVSGHGVAAALVMAGARAVLRDRVTPDVDLAELMGRLNRLLSADHAGERFMTMHLSVIDAGAGTFRWASAGHDPAVIYDPDTDRFEEIDRAEFPLGVLDEAEYKEHAHAAPLRPGQVITIGTDGVWEERNAAGEEFGKGRLRQTIRESAAGTAEQIVQALVSRLTDFRSGTRPRDDLTLVVIKVVAVGAAAKGRASSDRGLERNEPVDQVV